MIQVVSNYISQIELKKNDLLNEVDRFSLEGLLAESNIYKTVSPTNSSSSVSAPYRPWIIFGGGAALAGTAGVVVNGTESSDKNWAFPLLIAGFLSVAYGLVKMKNQHSVVNENKNEVVNSDFKNEIYDKISELTDNIINEWNAFIVSLNQAIQESIKSEQGIEVDKALKETYYYETIKIDKFNLYMALKNVSTDKDQILNCKKLVERYLENLKKIITLTTNNQTDRYKKVEMILSNL